MQIKTRFLGILLCGLGLSLGLLPPAAQLAQAGVFTMPHFVQPGEFSVGAESELTLADAGAGLAVNGKFTYGISYLSNLIVTLGSGGGPRKFRVGGAYTFDFFPDIEGQPGIGLGLQGFYYRLVDVSSLEFTAVPYVHKAFATGENGSFEPFIAIPFGAGFMDGKYQTIASFVAGSLFQTWQPIRWSIEIGIPISHSETYISAGVAYYH